MSDTYPNRMTLCITKRCYGLQMNEIRRGTHVRGRKICNLSTHFVDKGRDSNFDFTF